MKEVILLKDLKKLSTNKKGGNYELYGKLKQRRFNHHCGGDDFTRDLGMLCGSIARAIVDGAKVIAYNIASQQGAPEAWR